MADGVLAIFALAQIVPCWIWKGYVIVALWKWFVVPMGLPEIHIAHVLGLSITLGLLAGITSMRNSIDEIRKNSDDEMSTKIARIFLDWMVPGIVLLEGWILTHWM
jgi:hypothetical protein